MQLVEHLVKRVFLKPVKVDAEKVSERRAPHPIRHGVFGARRDQSIEHHRTGEPLHGCGQAAVAQNTVEFKAQPELVADMNGTGFAMALG
jgi:hypothetical protein